jgi:hypothetical protein
LVWLVSFFSFHLLWFDLVKSPQILVFRCTSSMLSCRFSACSGWKLECMAIEKFVWLSSELQLFGNLHTNNMSNLGASTFP